MRRAICLSLLLAVIVGCDDAAPSSPGARMPDASASDASRPDASPPDATPPDAAPPECIARGPERCDGVDDDCDGAIDEDFTVGTRCTVGRGACVSESVMQCTGAGDAVCRALPGEPTAEACNGIDDDCDGTVDEAIEATPCETGQPGVCAAGMFACVEGADVCTPATAPGAERCDGLDNDCDGAADEDIEPTEPCYTGPPETRGLGICRDGLLGCVDGAPACVGEVVPPAGFVFEERRYPLGRECRSVLLADLNADGALDIVCNGIAQQRLYEVAVLVNDGSGGFAAPVELDITPLDGGNDALAAADVDLDGTVDLVASAEHGFVVITDPLGPAPEMVAVPDMIELPDGAAAPIVDMLGVTVADLTGDGWPDIAFIARLQLSEFSLALAVNQGGGNLAAARAIVGLPPSDGVVSTHDIDGDGFTDVLMSLSSAGTFFARGGPGGPVDGLVQLAPAFSYGHHVADVTGDGRLDLVGIGGDELWQASFEQGPALGDRVSFNFPVGVFLVSLGVGQLDCEPEPDVLVLDAPVIGNPSIRAFLDASTLLDPVVLPQEQDSLSMAIGDIDGDGADDIAIGAEEGVRVHRRVP